MGITKLLHPRTNEKIVNYDIIGNDVATTTTTRCRKKVVPTSTQQRRRRSKKKSVSFRDIEIIEIEYCIGDHPCVTAGTVPIALNNNTAHSRMLLPLDTFEQFRPPKQRRVRKFSANTRNSILLRRGYSMEDINRATLEAIATRHQRASTLEQLQKFGVIALKKNSSSCSFPKKVSKEKGILDTKYRRSSPYAEEVNNEIPGRGRSLLTLRRKRNGIVPKAA